MIDIDEIWSRVKSFEGEVFHQKKGGEFTYEVREDKLLLSRTDWFIYKKHLEEALGLVPLKNTVPVQHLYAPSYIYAILMDERIRRDDW